MQLQQSIQGFATTVGDPPCPLIPYVFNSRILFFAVLAARHLTSHALINHILFSYISQIHNADSLVTL